MHDYTLINLHVQPEDFWIPSQKKGIMVFAIPGEPGLTELTGDFKIHFHEQQGDFYWFFNYLLFSYLVYFIGTDTCINIFDYTTLFIILLNF